MKLTWPEQFFLFSLVIKVHIVRKNKEKYENKKYSDEVYQIHFNRKLNLKNFLSTTKQF